MAQGLTVDQMQQVQHVACMAVLAMCARSVASSEFASSPEVGAVQITVTRFDGVEHSVDVEMLDVTGAPMGGLSL